MNEEKLKELGFELKKEFTVGGDKFLIKIFRKGIITVELDYNKKTGELTNKDVTFNENEFYKLTFDELKQLDKILNK